MTHALVTGATGFIGYHLIKKLVERGIDVTCLVRRTSDCSSIEPFRVRLVCGDVTDRESIRRSIKGVDVVFHAAGLTKCLHSDAFKKVNVGGSRNVAACCAERDRTPVLVHISSLAAAGPATDETPITEDHAPAPVSNYGRSKREGELAVADFAASVPTTIVRPPIVLGQRDRDGFQMFQSIARWRVHVVPGLADRRFSVIHGADLADALVIAAFKGQRIPESWNQTDGIYFVADREAPSYAELGRMIARALGRRRVLILRSPSAAVWTVGIASDVFSRLRRKPNILSVDKSREATAGSWFCSSDAFRRDTGWAVTRPLQDRLQETAQWYQAEGWI